MTDSCYSMMARPSCWLWWCGRMNSAKGSRGMARIYDAILACTILLIGSAMAVGYALSAHQSEQQRDLLDLASKGLIYMDQQGVLAPLVYRQESLMVQMVLSGILPEAVGYSFSVYSSGWKLLWTANDHFSLGSTSSASYYLSGYNGTADPRIVVLALSR